MISSTHEPSYVDGVNVAGAEGGAARRALAVPRIEVRLNAVCAEDVKALGDHRILLPVVAHLPGQTELVVLSERIEAEV